MGATGNATLTNARATVLGVSGIGGGLTLTSGGSLSISGAVAAGMTNLSAAGNLTIAAGGSLTATANDNVVLSATGNFIDNGGANAVTVSGAGRWLIYSNGPGGDAFGGLNSGDTAIWNTPAGGAVTASGNRYVFAYAPTLTVATMNDSTIYGTAATNAVSADYTITGFQPGVTGAYLGDTAATATSGAPIVTSAGSASTAGVGAYAYQLGLGTLASGTGYSFALQNAGTFTVNPAALTITASNQTKTYGQAASLGTAAFTETGLINSDTITGVTLASTGAAAAANVAGSPYAITASNAQGSGLSNYTISYANGALTVNPLAVSLSGTQIYNGTTAVTGSALSVTNLVGADSVTVAGSGMMAAKDVGSQALASLTGLTLNNTNYTLVGGSGSVSVTPATLTYAANAASRTYGAATPTLSGTVTGFVGADTQATATSGTLAFGTTATTASNVGTYAITGSGLAAANGDYVFVQAAGNGGALTINPAALTITANNASKIYGTVASLGTTAFSETGLVTANGDTLTGVTLASGGAAAAANVAGNPYSITASNATGSGLSNYTISYVAGALTVNPAALTITASNQAKTYGQAANLGSTAFTETGLVTANGDTIGGVTLASTGAAAAANVAGSPYAITASNATGSGLSNYTIGYVAGALTVNPAALTITANNASKTYGTVANLGTTAFTETGLVNSDTITGVSLASTGAAAAANVAGSPYAITASNAQGPGLSNYTFSYVPSQLTVNPLAVSLAGTQIYNGTPAVAGSALGVTNLVGTDSVTIAGSATMAAKDVGSQALVSLAGLTLNNANYTLVGGSGAVSVTPATLTYAAATASRPYGAATPALSGTVTGFVGPDTQATATSGMPNFSPTATTASNVGTYAIIGSGVSANNGDYVFAQAAGNATALTVTPAALTITGSKIYDTTAGFATGQLAVSGGVNGETVGLTAGSGTAGSANVGSGAGLLGGLAVQVAGGNASASNYALPATGTLTVTPATITVSGATGVTKTYDGTTALPAATPGFTASGIYAADTAHVTVTAGSAAYVGANAGPEAIDVSNLMLGGAAAGNYVLSGTRVAGSGTISPATLTYVAEATRSTYGSTPTGLTGAVTGFVGGQTLQTATSGSATFGTLATASSNVGTYAINGSGLTANSGNYVFAQAPANVAALTVTPAALTITANDASKTYGAAMPTLTASYTGLVNGDTAASLATAPTLSTAATAASPVNSYVITASGAVDPNYAISYVAGQLTVTPATPVPGMVTAAPPIGLAATGLGSTVDYAMLEAFGRPGEALPFAASTLSSLRSDEDGSLASQIVRDLSNPRFEEIIVCFRGACTLVPAPARTLQKTTQLETDVR